MQKLFSLPVLKYFTEVREELQKVQWPSRKQTQQKTLLVILVSVIVGVYISGLDIIFTKLTELLIK